MVTLEAIKDHPFCGKSKRKGDKYEAKLADAKLMVLLGLAKYAEADEPAPVVVRTRVVPVAEVTQVAVEPEPVVVVPVSTEQQTVSNDGPTEFSMVEVNIIGDAHATIDVVPAEDQEPETPAATEPTEPVKRGPGRPRGSYKTRDLKAEE